jgi:hypothetical protein
MSREEEMRILSVKQLKFISDTAYQAGAAAERNKLAQWMIDRGYATGHGDTTEDLLQELEWQIAENWTRGMVNGVQAEREACALLCDQLSDSSRDLRFGAAIRARGRH